jgi:diacylglycerol O-acyltransferase
MPRLSSIDRAFLLLETPERPMNIGVLFVLAPPRGARGGFAGQLNRAMLRCPVGPPFSYRLAPGAVPGLHSLVDDPDMDPRPQLHLHRVAKNTDLQELFRRVCELHVELLDRAGPMWEQHLFSGLAGGRVALYFKTHHAMIDGIGFIKALNTMVTTSPAGEGPRAIWEGLRHASPPSEPQRQGVPALLHTAGEARRTATDLLRLMWRQRLRDFDLGSGLMTPFVSTPDVLKTAPSPRRALAYCKVPLARVRAAAAAGNAKINDVMLTLIDAAMHRYIAERGVTLERPLIADIPVALEDHGGAGNRITILQVPMGRPGLSPAQRLRDVLHETRVMKREARELSGDALTLYSIIEHSIASSIESLGLGNLPMLANVVISNPAGLEQRVYFNGAAVEVALPVSVVAHHQVLNITVTTYVDELHVTLIALREAIPDLQRLADYTTEALDALEEDLARTTRARRPRRARKSRSPTSSAKAKRRTASRAIRR